MQRKRDGLVPIGEVFGGLNGPVKAIRDASPQARRNGQADRRQNPNPRIANAERRVKPLARLLRCATALRVTAPHGCGSRRLVWPKGSLSAHSPHNMNDNILYHALVD